MDTGKITIEIENISLPATERLRRIFTALIISGALDTKNGKVILHFDDNYALREIESHQKKWKGNTEKWEKPNSISPISPTSIPKPTSRTDVPSIHTSG